jgi:hypothetical protein
MRALSKAIFQRLVGDAQLTELLGSSDVGPSVFTKRPVDASTSTPLILAATYVSDVDDDYVNSHGRVVQRDVGIYGTDKQVDAVTDAAERVRALFHRVPVELDDYVCVSVVAAGPRDAPSDPFELGRVVTLTFSLRDR